MSQEPDPGFTSGVVESPRPLAPQRQDTDLTHPGQHPSITNVPVTPGIHISTYQSGVQSSGDSSYFGQDLRTLRNQMAQSPTEAAAGAQSDREVLRRMSLSASHSHESKADYDPKLENPSLSLSGSIISANFCIPHSLNFRKGKDWVRTNSS